MSDCGRACAVLSSRLCNRPEPLTRMNTPAPISLLICALGGEGGGVLSEWLIDTARHAGYAAQSTSIPGVAQRTGATTYYLEVFPQPLAALGGARPVFSLSPVPGALDALVSSELLETTRQISLGLCSPERTRVITSSSRTLTAAERMPLGDGRTDSDRLLQVVQGFSHTHQVFDMSAMARDCGTIVSAVMLGAIAGSGLLPFAREHYEAVITGSGPSAAATQRGFAAAFAHVQSQQGALQTVASLMSDEPATTVTTERSLELGTLNALPDSAQTLIRLGHARLVDYQDSHYAAQYLRRLQSLWQAEQSAPTSVESSDVAAGTVTETMARWLALWMAYDDIIRVADLKSRASRWERVRQEVKLGDDDLLLVYEHFKPGVPEFAGILPTTWAERLKRWDQRRQARGLAPWSRALKIGTHTVRGWLALRLLASLRWLRPSSSRHAEEMQMIERWIQAVLEGLRADRALGLEQARCGQLIKGYGTTNERGKHNLLHIIDHLARGPGASTDRANAVRAAREAALRDDSGKALDATLISHGAPARPVPVQPIRFMRKPPTGSAKV